MRRPSTGVLDLTVTRSRCFDAGAGVWVERDGVEMTVDVRSVWGALAALLCLACVVVGCGDSDGGDDDGAMFADGGAGTGGAGGSGGGGAGGSGGGGAGGTGGLPGGSCDGAITAETSCGGDDCAAIESPLAAQVCAITCCTADDACGTRRAYADDPTDCLPPAAEDSDCPDYTMAGGVIMGFDAGDGMSFPGCCAPSGRCGIISSIDTSCITSSALLPDLEPGELCGDAVDGGADDAGL
jgi:hypothetical protein